MGASTIFTYSNPVVRGNAPDPSVVRVGRDFFLATSSFEYLPGIIIRHSTDLVNWTIVGAAIQRSAQCRRDGQPGPIMLFAPTLRYHAGRFYLTCTNMAEGQGNFLLSADDPGGTWSDAIWIDHEAFDPSLFFDTDGTCYYTRRTLNLEPQGGDLGPIVQAVIDPSTGKLGPMRAITPGNRGFATNDIEGPHIYRIGAWYYLFSAEGGTWMGHMQTVARSTSVWGPYVPAPHNPVMTHRNRVLHPVQSLGHADLVEDTNGQWWALALGTRHKDQHHNLGRETFLLPVDWRDGWPFIGTDGGTELVTSVDRPAPKITPTRAQGQTDLLFAGWHWLREPDPCRADAAGILIPFGGGLTDTAPAPGALFRFQTEDCQTFMADLTAMNGDGAAGVAVYSDRDHHYCAMFTPFSGLAGGEIRFTRTVDDLVTTTTTSVATSAPRFVVTATPLHYIFHVVDGDIKVELGRGAARLLSAEACEWFVGANFALVAVGRAGGSARFSHVSW